MSNGFPFGSKGKELLLELKRAAWLPYYNEASVKDVVQEVNELYGATRQLQETAKLLQQQGGEIDSSVASPLILFHESILRNRRYILTYLQVRTQKLIRSRFEVGSVLSKEMNEKLSKSEKQFFSGFNQLVDDYMTTTDIDLTTNILPPRHLMVEVKALKDAGEVFTKSGSIVLKENNYYFLRRTDVELLIKQQLVEEVKRK